MIRLWLVCSLICLPAAVNADLIVSYYYDDEVRRFNGSTGASLGPFVAAGANGILGPGPDGIAMGADGRLYVALDCQACNSSISRFDGATGAPIDSIAPISGNGWRGLAFGAGGTLFAAAVHDDFVGRYDPSTGLSLGSFAVPGGPHDLLFAPNGELYISALFDGAIYRYNAATGLQLGTFGMISRPRGMEFGADGNLYVTSDDLGVGRFAPDGTYLGTFIPLGSGGLAEPNDVAFGPDGNLYVSHSAGVLRYNSASGAFIDAFIPDSDPSSIPNGYAFDLLFTPEAAAVPEPSTVVTVALIFAAVGLRLARRNQKRPA